MTVRPDLTVIVVTHNGREMALATLRSARARLGDVSCEWMVVDNASADGTPDAIEREFPDVRVFRRPNRGFAAGNNVALRDAAGRYVLLLNPDVEIESGTLADLVAALDRRPRVGIASVPTLATDGRLLATIRRFPTPARSLGEALGGSRVPLLRGLCEQDDDFRRYFDERSVDWLVGSFLMARRTAIDEVGPLDEGFFLYAEETDWCRRFRQHGWDVRHLPLMTITHHEGDSARPALVAQLGYSRRRCRARSRSTPHLPCATCCGSSCWRRRQRSGRPCAGAHGPRRRAWRCCAGPPHPTDARDVPTRTEDLPHDSRPASTHPGEPTMSRFGKVLVTGGAGAIGSNVTDELVLAGAEEIVVLDNLVRGRRENLAWAEANGPVTLVDGDIRDRALVRRLMSGVDVVFHLAAIRITQCADEPRLALEVLVEGTYNVVEAAVDARVRKVVASSSASVYGLAEEFPTGERHHPYANDTIYGAAKAFNEGLLRSMHAMSRLDYVALRYFNVYGPRMDVHGLYTEVLVRWMERIAAGEPPLILGDGSQTMDFVYIGDVARANLLAARSAATDAVFNVARGEETSLLQLAELLLAVMGSDLSVEHGPERSVNRVSRRLADTRLAREELGFEAEVGLEDGLARLVEWWRTERAGGATGPVRSLAEAA
jgi:UDP-glucose 4-epimerase